MRSPSALSLPWQVLLLVSLAAGCAQPMADGGGAAGDRPGTPPQQQSVGGQDQPGAGTGSLPCTPCETSADCGGPDDLCIINSVDGASFCSTACSSAVDCPKAFLCVAIQGASVKQCIPESGSCDGYATEPSTPDPEPDPGGVGGGSGTPTPDPGGDPTPDPGTGGTPDPGGNPTPDPDPGTGGTGGAAPAPYCYGMCLVGVYNDCTCHPSDPCGWAGDGYCDDVCGQLFPGSSFDDSSDCGGGTGPAPDPGGQPDPGGNPTDCGTSCSDGIYDSCTCSAADPCGWSGDSYCDDTCYTLSPADHFDDGPDCGGNSGGDPAPGGDPTPPPAGSDSFAVTSVQDGLDAHDATLMASGLQAMGYSQYVRDTNVTTQSLASYLSQELTVVYHTGHGYEGSVVTANGALQPGTTSIRAHYSIFATCLTLQQSWASAFGPTAQAIMGYTEISFDGIDDNVAEDFLARIGSSQTHVQAWYLANAGVGMLADRWAAYVRQNGSVIEYSARSGNKPMSAAMPREWADLGADGNIQVDPGLLGDMRTFEGAFSQGARASALARDLDVVNHPITSAPDADSSADHAVAQAEAWIDSHGGMPPDASLDAVVPIRRGQPGAPSSLVGYLVRYGRLFRGMPLLANGRDHHLAVLVGGEGVLSDTRAWPELRNARASRFHARPMQVGQAIRASAPALGRMLKGASVHVVDASPVMGVRGSMTRASDLEPAFELHTAEGLRVVVSALTGRPLR